MHTAREYLLDMIGKLYPWSLTNMVVKQNLHNDHFSEHAIVDGEHLTRHPLDEELQAINDCWRQEDQFFFQG